MSDQYDDGFYDGQQSKQSEVDELQKRVKELELINFDSELHFDAAKEHIDHLQERIDDLKSFCIKGVESNMLSIEYNQALIDMHKILKGEETK